MDAIIIPKVFELAEKLIIAAIAALPGVFLAIHFGFKKSFNETLGARVVERKVELYDELLDAAFKIRLNRKRLFNDKYLIGLYGMVPRCRVLANKEVRSKYENLFNYLLGLRTEYTSESTELEKQFYCFVSACDYYDTDDIEEINVPQHSGADREYDRKLQALQESFLPSCEKLDELLNALSDAIYQDLNRG